jgi:hypothetical protein
MGVNEWCRRLDKIADNVCSGEPQDQRDDLKQDLVIAAFHGATPEHADSYICRLMRWRYLDHRRRHGRQVKTIPLDEDLEVPDDAPSSLPNTLRHPFEHPMARRWIYNEARWYEVSILHLWTLEVMSGLRHGAYVRAAKRASIIVSYVNDSFRQGARGADVVELTEESPISVEVTPDRVRRTVQRFRRHMRKHAAQFAFE